MFVQLYVFPLSSHFMSENCLPTYENPNDNHDSNPFLLWHLLTHLCVCVCMCTCVRAHADMIQYTSDGQRIICRSQPWFNCVTLGIELQLLGLATSTHLSKPSIWSLNSRLVSYFHPPCYSLPFVLCFSILAIIHQVWVFVLDSWSILDAWILYLIVSVFLLTKYLCHGASSLGFWHRHNPQESPICLKRKKMNSLMVERQPKIKAVNKSIKTQLGDG